jgi:hypothetical protein
MPSSRIGIAWDTGIRGDTRLMTIRNPQKDKSDEMMKPPHSPANAPGAIWFHPHNLGSILLVDRACAGGGGGFSI